MKPLRTDIWSEPQLAALGSVRTFLAACDTVPRDRKKLRKLAADAHIALLRVEVAYDIDQPRHWEHP